MNLISEQLATKGSHLYFKIFLFSISHKKQKYVRKIDILGDSNKSFRAWRAVK